MLLSLFLLFSTMVGNSLGEDAITSTSREEHVLCGSSVTLSCNYSALNLNNLQSYHQHPGSKPEFLIVIYAEEKIDKWFTVKHDKTNRHVQLEISSAEVTDSALYYCALQSTVTGNP
ncbi:hypothetical protein COCON_G00091560 [Conger conger]|uniref:Ig-like domain-containing protein n=1 Tax=Conger conger TaxID=82655 RepID=A0A9Q1DLY9_CONCO|nr:hypothetical protein COCON_G00091560 [Conger conger]